MEEKKNLEVITGDGSNLDISPVYDHLNASIPKSANKKPKHVLIPKESKKHKPCKKRENRVENK